MDYIAEIASPWIGDGTSANPYRAKLGDDYPLQSIDGTTNKTASIPPNYEVWRVVTDEQTINAIAGNDAYFVLWAEPVTSAGVAG